jgi:sulfoquinovosidase
MHAGNRNFESFQLLQIGLALFLLNGCTCAGPTTIDQTIGGAQVEYDSDSSILSISASGQVLLSGTLSQWGFRTADALFEMEFGMFNVEEFSDGEFQGPAQVLIQPESSEQEILLDMQNMDGASIGSIRIHAPKAKHLTVELSTSESYNRSQMVFDCLEEDHFLGFGAQTHDVDHKGQRIPLWVSEQGVGKLDTNELPDLWQVLGRRHTTHVPQPVTVTSRNTALVLETSAYSVFDLCATKTEELALENWEGSLVLHLFFADSPIEVMSGLTDFVGRPPLPAPWLHAPWNDAIFGRDNVLAFAQFLRDNEIPSSAIWSEDWRGGADSGDLYRLSEDWRLDEELYPDYTGMTETLRDLGIYHQVYFNTFLYDDADVYPEALESGYAVLHEDGEPYHFAGVNAGFSQSALVDLTNPDAQAWTKNELKKALDLGSRGWMADYAEWMPVHRAVVHSGEDPALAHNRYPVLWQQMQMEVLEENDLLDEAIVYVRSGHLFSQGHTQVIWAGDQRTSFDTDDGLPTVIPIGLGLSAAGYLFYAHDIAGYQSSTNDPTTEELFYRWTELGAFSPVMRTHHGTHARFNWNLSTDENTTAHWKRYASIHIRLYPYARALAKEATENGVPMWLPMGMLYPADDVWGIMDQFFFGDALLVAPVVHEGMTQRDILFPSARFAPMLTAGEAIQGPATVTVDAPLAEIPVYIRAGGIVPLTENTPLTLLESVSGMDDLDSTNGDRVVYVGLGANGSFTEIDGASYSLEGTGTDSSGLSLNEDGSVTIEGNASITGGDFMFSTQSHPADRTIQVFFR